MTGSMASRTLEEALEKYSGDDKIGSLLEEQRRMLAELRDYMSNARGARVKASGMEKESDLTSGPDASFAKAKVERSPEAKYPEFSEEEHSIRLNLCVNLVLIGSQGEDDNLLSVPHETLEFWLEHLTSVVRHATVLRGSTPSGSGSPRSSSEETTGVVEYVYRFRVVDVARKVRDALEAHLRAFLREDSESPISSQSVDERENSTNNGMKERMRMFMPSWRMEEFLGSLATELAAAGGGNGGRATEEDRPPVVAYTFFVLNPRRTWIYPTGGGAAAVGGGGYDWTYGYRCVLSPSVMQALAADPEVVRRAEDMERAEQVRWRMVDGVNRTAFGIDDFDLRDELLDYNLHVDGQRRTRHLERADHTESTYQWAVERVASLPINTDNEVKGDSPRSWDVSEEKALLLQGNPDAPPEGRARTLLRDVLELRRGARDSGQGSAAGGARTDAIGSSCLTESWVSGERFAWVDLQAGPFEWGPASRGEGFKSASSLSTGLLRLDRGGSSSKAETSVSRGHWNMGDDLLSVSLDGLRGRLSARIGRLTVLEKNMACGDGLVSEREASDGNSSPRRGRRVGIVAVACEEISSQLEFLRRFQERERGIISAADATTAEESADVLQTLRRSHVAIFEEVLGELAPAPESDSSRRAQAGKLGVESQALLARLAAMVSSLARTVITPPSALPLPLLPPSAKKSNKSPDDTLGLGNETPLPFQGHSDHQAPSSLQPLSQYRFPTGPSLALWARNGGMNKMAALAAVSADGKHHASSLHPLLSPPSPPSALEFFVPEDLAFTLYVVRAQDVYPPLGTPPPLSRRKDRGREADRGAGNFEDESESEIGASDSLGFDLLAFQAGAMSLKLPNQRASFTVHQVAASKDPVFATALAGATRESLVNVVTPQGVPQVERRVSIDSAKIRHQLRARVVGGEGAEVGGKQGAPAAAEQAQRHTRHITIFLFSMAGPESVYVDELWRARAVGGDMVVVAQSEQRLDGEPPLTCGGKAVEEDPRNPLRQALAALGSTVGGLVPSQYSWHEANGGRVILDWRWSMSESPMSPLVPHARFSQLDQDVIYRTHIVRALSASAQLTRAGSSVLLDALSREASRNILEGSLSDSLWKTRTSLQDISSFRAELMRKADMMEFDYVVRNLNVLLDMSRNFYENASRLESEVLAAPRRLAGLDYTGTSSTAGAQIDAPSGLLLLVLVGSGAVAAVWLFRRLRLLSRSRHLKVN